MLKALGVAGRDGGPDSPLYIVGLSAENCRRLVAGEPIRIDLDELAQACPHIEQFFPGRQDPYGNLLLFGAADEAELHRTAEMLRNFAGDLPAQPQEPDA